MRRSPPRLMTELEPHRHSAKEAIKDFKDDAGGYQATHSLESQIAGSRQQLAAMDDIINSEVAQIAYAMSSP